MANATGARPWVLDTAGSVSKIPLKIDHFEFVNYSVGTDSCVLQDVNGREVWQGNAQSDLSNVESRTIGWINGLDLASITAGKVLVYLA